MDIIFEESGLCLICESAALSCDELQRIISRESAAYSLPKWRVSRKLPVKNRKLKFYLLYNIIFYFNFKLKYSMIYIRIKTY